VLLQVVKSLAQHRKARGRAERLALPRQNETVFSRNGIGQYFRVGPEPNCIDFRVKQALASCYGVNLAFAGRGRVFVFVVCFFWSVKSRAFLTQRGISRAWGGRVAEGQGGGAWFKSHISK